MSTKTATIRARIEPNLKREGDAVLEGIGLSQSDFLTMAYKQLVRRKGLPFSAAPEPSKENIERALAALRDARTWAVSGGENSTDFIRRMRYAADGRPIELLEGTDASEKRSGRP